MLRPERLRKGDRIAIISPATVVKEEYVRGAEKMLRECGYEAEIFPAALGPASGTYAAKLEARVSDLRQALTDPGIKGILCARGGYGCVHLLSEIPVELVSKNPKWMMGFSDVSALHALWEKGGVMSIHSPMAKHLTIEGATDDYTRMLLSILEGEKPEYESAPHPFNREGVGEGTLRGGNLAVLNGLADTPYDILKVMDGEEVILFIEDISEAVYAVERMLMRLVLSGSLRKLKGLIVGRFTDYKEDRNHGTMERMIDNLLHRHGIEGFPVAFDFPVGHVKENYPLVEGSRVRLEIGPEGVVLREV